MDDYFYPSFTKENVNTAFDAREYNESEEKRQGKDIYTYRCGQVNSLVRQIKETIREPILLWYMVSVLREILKR